MNQPNVLFAALAVLAIMLLLYPQLRLAVRYVIVGRSKLSIEELPNIFNGYQSFHIDHNPQKTLNGAERSTQIFDNKVSIMYHTTKKPNGFIETVDIACPGKSGMIFTLVNDEVACIEHTGGTIQIDPELTNKEEKALRDFMVGLRNCVQ